MNLTRAAGLVLAALALLACRSAPAGVVYAFRPPAVVPAPTLAACAAGRDVDSDGLSDGCELHAAATFAPILLQDARDCEWDGSRIEGGYLHAVQRIDTDRVRIAYLPAYHADCGWQGAKCILPGVDCDRHEGDSEAIIVEAEVTDAGWRPVGLFLSAHCFDSGSDECRWYRERNLRAIDWAGGRPIVWVSSGRHANYPNPRACDRGHYRLDTCDFDYVEVDVPVARERNLGSAAAPAAPDGCVTAAAASGRTGVECFWNDEPFAGWHADAPGVTSYFRYLDEIAGFVAPIDRLAWLAGCWERRTESSLTEEQWMAPRGGTMLGMGRVVRAGETVDFETMRIEARGDTLVFVAHPSGQAQAEFRAASVEDDGVVFENPAHDFPQRVIYRHAAGDSLHARIEGLRDGAERGIDFRMGRTQCGH